MAQVMPSGKPRPSTQTGFTLVAVLVATTLAALSANGVMFVLAQQAQRDREVELLRRGKEIAYAIKSYYEASPGVRREFPASWEDLLEDKRQVGIRRHLRRAYEDPMLRDVPWGIVQAQSGGIQGVFSTSTGAPIRTGPVTLPGLRLPAANAYRDWQFLYHPDGGGAVPGQLK